MSSLPEGKIVIENPSIGCRVVEEKVTEGVEFNVECMQKLGVVEVRYAEVFGMSECVYDLESEDTNIATME